MRTSRKDFLKCALAAGAFPAIVPSSVLGADAPSNKLQIGIIGLGRIGTTMDIGGLVANQDLAMLTTICDVDSVRLANMKQLAEKLPQGAGRPRHRRRDDLHAGPLARAHGGGGLLQG